MSFIFTSSDGRVIHLDTEGGEVHLQQIGGQRPDNSEAGSIEPGDE